MGLRDQFERDGYGLVRGVFDATEIAHLEADFDRIVASLVASGEEINARWGGNEMDALDGGASVVLHTHNVQQYSAAWMRALLAPRFLDAAEQILGPDIVLHHSKLFQKPPEKGAPFPMHQDWSYFPTIHDTMMAAVIHVSRADDSMGCLRVVPGSHKLGRLDDSSGLSPIHDFTLEGAVPLEAEPGDVAFFHYLTVHGSKPNGSAHTRKTVLVQMHAGNDRVEPGVQHTEERLVLRGFNHHATRSQTGGLK